MIRKNLPIKGTRGALSSKVPLALGFAVVGLLLLIFCNMAAASDETIDMFTIADPTGDWGFPSPYGHYPRGPGYIPHPAGGISFMKHFYVDMIF